MKWLEALKKKASDIKRDTYTLYYAYRDPRLAWGPKLFAACVAAYAFSPIDLVPDFIPVLGYLDDLVLIPAGIVIAVKLIPPDILEDARVKAAQALLEKKPVNWIAGAGILLLWALIIFLVVKRFFFD